jgi:DMSO reductase family type II enzyme heme b subunit
MKKTFDLVAAPTGMQPGGYVPKAYGLRIQPFTKSATLELQSRTAGWSVRLGWSCPDPVRDASRETDLFVDAAALLVPTVADAPWVTMGAPGMAVEAALWRADRPELLRIRAEGLGTVKRQAAPEQWRAEAAWEDGRWSVAWELSGWPALAENAQLTFAIWRGAAADRGGLKSICPQWIPFAP